MEFVDEKIKQRFEQEFHKKHKRYNNGETPPLIFIYEIK